MTDRLDATLEALLARIDRRPDEAFVRRVALQVKAEQRLQLARRKLLRRFAVEGVSGIVAVLAFVILATAGPAGPDGFELVPFSPAMFGVVLLALWAAATLPVGAGEVG
jgi:hypothetical protein